MTKARLYSSNVQHKKSEIDRFIMNHHRIGMDGGIGIMYIHTTLCANVIYLPKIFLIKFINNNFSFILRTLKPRYNEPQYSEFRDVVNKTQLPF